MTKDKKPSLVMVLTDYLKEKRGRLIHGGDLERVGQANFYEAETAKRRLREMTNAKHRNYNPMIEKQKPKGCVAYRYRIEDEQTYTPVRVGDEIVNMPSLF